MSKLLHTTKAAPVAAKITKGKERQSDVSVASKKGSHVSNSKDLQNKHNIFSKLVSNSDKVEVDDSKHTTKSRLEKPVITKKVTTPKSEPKNQTEKPKTVSKSDKHVKGAGERSKSGHSSTKKHCDTPVNNSKIIPTFKIKNHEKVDLIHNDKKPIMKRIVTAIELNRHRNKIEPTEVEEKPLMSRFVKAIEIKRHHNKIEPKHVEERTTMSRIARAIDIKRHHNKSEENVKQPSGRPMVYRIVNRAMEIKPSFIFHDNSDTESITSKEKLKVGSKNSLEFHLSHKIWQVLSHDLFGNNGENEDIVKATDSEMKRHILTVIKKYNKKEMANSSQTRQETQTDENPPIHNSNSRKKMLKQTVKRQLWQWAKTAIRNNEHWSKVFAENHIMLDNINIDKLDLSLIDIDALGIDNKMLKKTIVWLFK